MIECFFVNNVVWCCFRIERRSRQTVSRCSQSQGQGRCDAQHSRCVAPIQVPLQPPAHHRKKHSKGMQSKTIISKHYIVNIRSIYCAENGIRVNDEDFKSFCFVSGRLRPGHHRLHSRSFVVRQHRCSSLSQR